MLVGTRIGWLGQGLEGEERGLEWHQDIFFSHVPLLYLCHFISNALIILIVQKCIFMFLLW